MDARGWDERYAASELVWGTEPNRFVRDVCSLLPPGRAVDLACGEGRNSIWLAGLGWQVLGVDYSAAGIDRARALTERLPAEVAGRLTWRVDDVSAPQQPLGQVDLAVIAYLHLPPKELEQVLDQAVGALQDQGRLVLVGHDRRNLTEGVSGPQDPTMLYQPEALSRGLRGRGLTVDAASTVERPTDAGVALDTLVIADRA